MIPEKKKQITNLRQQPFQMPAQKRETYPEVTLSVGGKQVTISHLMDRYDDLLGRFGRPLPAVGFALGVEKLHIALAGEEGR